MATKKRNDSKKRGGGKTKVSDLPVSASRAKKVKGGIYSLKPSATHTPIRKV